MSEGQSKPAVLIVGGLGFIGRFLALHIHKNNLASELRIVDKVLPQLAWLAPEFQDACSQDRFIQADASREQSFSRVFDRPNGQQFDYIFNCAGETRHSQPEEVYKLRSHALSVGLGKEAARRKIRAFVECSTAMIYKSGSSPRKEDDKKHPWHKLAEWKLKTCEALAEIVGLRLCILRLPHVYGEYDSGYFATGVCLARIHQHDDSELRLLFSKDLKVNTLHVRDAARALWTAATWRDSKGTQLEAGTPFRFNVVDHNDTKQAHVAGILTSIFGIKVTFTNTLVSQLAKLNLDDAVDEMNEFALQAWADLLEEHHIERHGPISPFLERDVIKDQDLSIDGSSFEQTTGFKSEINFNVDTVKEIIESYKRMGWWP